MQSFFQDEVAEDGDQPTNSDTTSSANQPRKQPGKQSRKQPTIQTVSEEDENVEQAPAFRKRELKVRAKLVHFPEYNSHCLHSEGELLPSHFVRPPSIRHSVY